MPDDLDDFVAYCERNLGLSLSGPQREMLAMYSKAKDSCVSRRIAFVCGRASGRAALNEYARAYNSWLEATSMEVDDASHTNPSPENT